MTKRDTHGAVIFFGEGERRSEEAHVPRIGKAGEGGFGRDCPNKLARAPIEIPMDERIGNGNDV